MTQACMSMLDLQSAVGCGQPEQGMIASDRKLRLLGFRDLAKNACTLHYHCGKEQWAPFPDSAYTCRTKDRPAASCSRRPDLHCQAKKVAVKLLITQCDRGVHIERNAFQPHWRSLPPMLGWVTIGGAERQSLRMSWHTTNGPYIPTCLQVLSCTLLGDTSALL